MEVYSSAWPGHPSAPIGSYALTGLPSYCTSYGQRYAAALSYAALPNGSWERAIEACAASTPISRADRLQAIVLRSYEGFPWHADDILHTRALLTELVLRTGGRYRLHILVEVKSDEAVYASEEARQRVLDRAVPAEFRELAWLWTENMITAMYPGVSRSSRYSLARDGNGTRRGLQGEDEGSKLLERSRLGFHALSLTHRPAHALILSPDISSSSARPNPGTP